MKNKDKSKYLIYTYKNINKPTILYKQYTLIKKRIILCVLLRKRMLGGHCRYRILKVLEDQISNRFNLFFDQFMQA